MKELILSKRHTLKEVAEAIGVYRDTIGAWTDNAPIGKLYAIAKYIDVPIGDVIECFNPDRDSQTEIEPDRN